VPVKFIAEISSNHNRDLLRAKEMIQKAVDIGCDGVKFQLFKINQLFAQEILNKSEEHRRRKEWELPIEFIPELTDFTHKQGLSFSCTPFYLDAVKELNPFVDFYKIASYELLWKKLFERISETGKPIVFATGMAALEEIISAIETLAKGKSKDITILHCSSAYPTPANEANLKSINTIRQKVLSLNTNLFINMGWSDHTISPAVIYRAVHQYNISMVEFHLDLDGKGEEYKSGHCWLPEEIEPVIKNVKVGYLADGLGEKEPGKSEMADRDWRADPDDGLRPLKKIRKDFLSH
jgi:sialic acid synthase SpsE